MSHIRKNTGIYCFENKINGKKYIGQAYNMERRLYEHEYYLAKGKDKCISLQRAISKYDRANFDVYILEICEPSELNDREIFWISKLNTHDKRYGYNISTGGNSGLIGYKHSPEMGRKVSMAKKGTRLSEEHKRKISVAQKGKFVSEETKLKMSQNSSRPMLGKKHSQETIAKLRVSHGGENAYQFGTKSPKASSQYYGVGRLKSKGHIYWTVNIKVKGVRTHIGSSKDEIEAALLYDSYVLENNLPNPLNFPELPLRGQNLDHLYYPD